MADRDYYNILDVSRNADSNEIKKSYRKLAMKYHPDRNKGDEKAEKKFKEISEAYDTLKDPQKRSLYDNPPPSFNFHQPFNGGQHPFEDIFSQMFGQGGDPFHGRHANPADAEVEQHPAEYAAAAAHRGQRPQRVPDLPLPAIRQSGGGSQADGSSQRQSGLPRGTTASDEGRLDMTRRDEAEDEGQKGDDEGGDGR